MEINILIAGIFTIVGTILGWFLNYSSTKKITKELTFHKACSEFRKAFIPYISSIQSRKKYTFAERDIVDSLKKYAIKHREAYIEFRYMFNLFNPGKIADLNKAWLEFSCADYQDKGKEPYYNYWFKDLKLSPDANIIYENAIKRIDKLLKFAEHN